jgi:hypothetical protein
MNKTEPFFCKWHECGLPWYRKTRQMRIVMAVREIDQLIPVLAALSVSLFGSKLHQNRSDFPQYFSL